MRFNPYDVIIEYEDSLDDALEANRVLRSRMAKLVERNERLRQQLIEEQVLTAQWAAVTGALTPADFRKAACIIREYDAGAFGQLAAAVRLTGMCLCAVLGGGEQVDDMDDYISHEYGFANG